VSGHDLPTVNAMLNGASTFLIVAGYAAVRSGRIRLHKALMLSALTTSALFLACYLFYHFVVRQGEATRYEGELRPLYLVLLFSHTILAAVAAPLVLISAGLGLSGKLTTHKKLAIITLPIWLYVSVTGVVIYLFLKDLYPKG
jgi:uncharacterized membrane protein YozB (DUF420 family)